VADWFCPDRSAAWDRMKAELVGTLEAKNSLLYGTQEVADEVRWAKWYFKPTQPAGLYGIKPKHGYSGVDVPGKSCLLSLNVDGIDIFIQFHVQGSYQVSQRPHLSK